MSNDAIDLLLMSELLGGVSEESLRGLEPPPVWVSAQAGDTLIEQGQEGEAFYLLVHGRLRVFVTDGTGANNPVGDVLPGEGVGEMALLTDDLTSATVRAMHDCELIKFSRASYKQLMEQSPEAASQITRTIIKRLRSGLSAQKKSVPYAAIAVVPTIPDIDLARFVGMLVDQMSSFATTSDFGVEDLSAPNAQLLRDGRVLSAKERRDISQELKATEAGNDITVYAADFEPTEWTETCLKQADLVLMVGSVESDPSTSDAERTLINRLDPDLAPRIELVLLHPGEWHPRCGTARWLALRNLAEFHHLRAWSETDFARLARLLTGNGINLVLGGGGARGFAQIGALRALLEAGIPIDRVAGTSIGSLIGALYALGKSVDEIIEINRRLWLEGKPLSDYTIPVISFVRGRRLHNLIKDLLHDWEVEDLPIRFFCVSGNLTSTDLMMHDRGALWEGVRASGSLPGAGPPMFLRGQILVDGGVLNNLPGDIMMERFSGAVIAIDVSPQAPMSVPEDIDEVPSGWMVLLKKLNPFSREVPLPGIFEILYRTATLSSDRLAKQTHSRTDLLLVPPVGGYTIVSFKDMDRLIEIGYHDAVAALHGELNARIERFVDRSALPPPENGDQR